MAKYMSEDDIKNRRVQLAGSVTLKNQVGMLKRLDLGCNFWLILLGPIIPLFQKEFKIAGIWIGLSILAGILVGDFALFFTIPLMIYYVIRYNKCRIERYLMEGWIPATEFDREILVYNNILTAE